MSADITLPRPQRPKTLKTKQAKKSTSVINKLRIQGSSASLGDPSLRRSAQRGNIDACDTPRHFAFHQTTNNIGKVKSYNSPNISHPNSAPSRKQSFMQRVQEANRGLTSSEQQQHNHPAYSNDYTPEKNTIHFLLCGKPVNGEYDNSIATTSSTSPFSHKRVGNYKTSTTEQYRSRHRFRDMADFYEGSGVPNHSVTIGPNDDFFYLGPDSSPLSNNPHPSRRSQHPSYLPPQTAPGGITEDLNITKPVEKDYPSENITPLGCENKSVVSEATLALANYDHENKKEKSENGFHDFHDTRPGPHPTPVPTKRRQTKSRCSYTDHQPSAIPSDPTLLKQCLFVQQSHNSVFEPETTAGEIFNHKKGFRGKTTPARNSKSMNNINQKALGGSKDNVTNKYFFNSVESYVHFNKIYPQADTNNPSSPLAAKGIPSKSGRLGTHFPRMEGFSPHCTDTLLLKMMFEMNKPTRSLKSVSKYSDVAVHKDLDEFLVVGTPSLSRSASVNSSGLGLGASTQTNSKSREISGNEA